MSKHQEGKQKTARVGRQGGCEDSRGQGHAPGRLLPEAPTAQSVCRWVQWARGGRLDADSGVVLMQPGDGSDLHRKGAEWKPTNQETSLL